MAHQRFPSDPGTSRSGHHRDVDPSDEIDDPLDPFDSWRPPVDGSLSVRFEGMVRDRLGASPGGAISLVAVAVVVLGVGWWFLRPPAPPIEASIPLATTDGGGAPGAVGGGDAAGSAVAEAPTTTTVAVDVVVQAAGAVTRPGVYRLPSGARVDDLVREAGGLSDDADVDRVNLAAPVADGERVWVPRAGEDPPEVVTGTGGGVPAPAAPGAPAGPGAGTGTGTETEPVVVDLNTATAEELDTLPGVGPATAASILAYREEHGRFGSVDELLEVRGIGDAKLEAVRPLVTV